MSTRKWSDKDKIFIDSIGQKATVLREDVTGETKDELELKLAELGLLAMGKYEHLLKSGYAYKGSAALHIFLQPTFDQLDIITQVNGLHVMGCPEVVAAKAFEDLLGLMKGSYNQRRGRLRSGF